MRPTFSVVIPLYNKENYIASTLKSVLRQSFEDYEIIIVDDGSTDKSAQVVSGFKNSSVKILRQKNQGVSTARNNGIRRASGKFIALLDADDFWYPNHLKELKKTIDRFPDAGIYATGYEILLNKKILRNAVYPDTDRSKIQLIDDYFKSSVINPIIWTSASAFLKDRFDEIGPFDPKLRTAQDLDFFVRAALNFPIAWNPKVTMRYHKVSENNLAQSQFNEDREYFINKFNKEERENKSLKKYLDVNRFALVIRCKIIKDKRWKRILPQISLENLTRKQRLLLKSPRKLLLLLKHLQTFLISQNLYLTAFK